MDLSDGEKDLLQALKGTAKSALSLMPVLGQAFAGLDAYRRSSFDRNVQHIIEHLKKKVNNLEQFARHEWFKTEEGQQFTRKVVDAALDAQLDDKQELFVNALINATIDHTTSQLEKLKFVDILRHLSLASLIVLADMHKMFVGQVRGPGRNPEPNQPYPLVDATRIAEKLSHKFTPYLVTSAVSEMESEGLFSRTGEWKKDATGRYISGGGFSTELCYTDFAARFVEFITVNEKQAIQSLEAKK